MGPNRTVVTRESRPRRRPCPPPARRPSSGPGRYEIVDSDYTVDGGTAIFVELPKEATAFLAFPSLDGAALAVYILRKVELRTSAQGLGSVPTVCDLTFRGVTGASGQADIEASEWTEGRPKSLHREDGEPPETRFHVSLQVAWLDGPPGG